MSTITSIRVTPQELRIGKQRWYYDTSVQILPENADCSYVNWRSSDESIATVNSAGHIYTKKAGNVMIIASACDGSGASDFVDLFVKDSIDVRTIQFDKTKLAIKNGSSVIPEYTVTPSNAGDQTVTFTSGNTNIATVTNGTINAVGVGETTITATANDGGGAKKTFRLIVTEGEPVTSVTVTPEAATLYMHRNESGDLVGDSMTLSKEVLPSNAANKNVVWESTNTNVATVNSQSGTVTARGVGVAQIFARSQDGSEEFGYCVVEVQKLSVSSVTVEPTAVTIESGDTIQLEATVSPYNAFNREVVWTSSDTEVATVDRTNGIVTGVHSGIADIKATATDGSKEYGSCIVDVFEIIPIEAASIIPKSLTLDPGETAKLRVKTEPENATVGDIMWISKDPDIASVDSEGNVTAVRNWENYVSTTTIYAYNEDRSLVCEIPVSVDTREKVFIRRDRTCDDVYFNICFEESSTPNLIWKNVGCDLSNMNNRSPVTLRLDSEYYDSFHEYEKRYLYNTQQTYTVKQLALIYLFDPLGLEYYMRQYASTHHKEKSMSSALALRDSVYLQIFGTKELDKGEFYFNIDGDEQKYCYGYTYQVTGAAREKVYSNAEALFGSHVTIDWGEFWKAVISAAFSLVIPDWMTYAQLGVNAIQAICFSEAVAGTINDTVSTFIEKKRLQINDDIANGIQSNFEKKVFKWSNKIITAGATALTTALTSMDDIFLSLEDLSDDVEIQTRASFQGYRVEIIDSELQISLHDVIGLSSYMQNN